VETELERELLDQITEFVEENKIEITDFESWKVMLAKMVEKEKLVQWKISRLLQCKNCMKKKVCCIKAKGSCCATLEWKGLKKSGKGSAAPPHPDEVNKYFQDIKQERRMDKKLNAPYRVACRGSRGFTYKMEIQQVEENGVKEEEEEEEYGEGTAMKEERKVFDNNSRNVFKHYKATMEKRKWKTIGYSKPVLEGLLSLDGSHLKKRARQEYLYGSGQFSGGGDTEDGPKLSGPSENNINTSTPRLLPRRKVIHRY